MPAATSAPTQTCNRMPFPPPRRNQIRRSALSYHHFTSLPENPHAHRPPRFSHHPWRQRRPAGHLGFHFHRRRIRPGRRHGNLARCSATQHLPHPRRRPFLHRLRRLRRQPGSHPKHRPPRQGIHAFHQLLHPRAHVHSG